MIAYCFARVCGTCWACKAADEQTRAIRSRDQAALVPRLPADLQALFAELRGSGFAEDLAERLVVGDTLEVNHGSQSAKKSVAACGTNAHPLVGPEGQPTLGRTGAELAIRLGPKLERRA